MAKRKKQFILPQMFDVRPTDESGELNVEKIISVKRVVKIKPRRYFPSSGKKIGNVFYDLRKPDIPEKEAMRFKKVIDEEKERPVQFKNIYVKQQEDTEKHGSEIKKEWEDAGDSYYSFNTDYFSKFQNAERPPSKNTTKFFSDLLYSDSKAAPKHLFSPEAKSYFGLNKSFFSFAGASLAVLFLIFVLGTLGRGMKIKNSALSGSQEAYASLISAKNDLSSKDYQKASFDFSAAYDQFNEISNEIDSMGKVVVETSRFIPLTSKLSSGSHLAKAGKDISGIGIKVSDTIQIIQKVKNPLSDNGSEPVSFLNIFQEADNNLREISALSNDLNDNLNKVNPDDIPAEKKEQYLAIKKQLPQISQTLAQFVDESRVFVDVLGGNGPRKYLFLFQNNQEMRATGGFIGSYGVLDIFNGRVRKFFVDGIFNPDGQLKEKVVPPAPIQKISAAWSLHDSNWFPDFPASAEKASWFYEKTGGPTVDGIITMTPTVMQKLLEVTGPIEMPEYEVTVDKDNFLEQIQYEVEVDYDKELNQPKKILADLAPKILDKIFNGENMEDSAKVMNMLIDSLNEKQILIYSKNYEIEKILSEQGWSGEVLDTQKDYLSVINTNINGFKTDGMIDENISHLAEIQNDGSIVDTVTITRHHNGGDAQFEWWNKVNADYMRVYVPRGSQLISVSGQTREFDSPPLDYNSLGFKKDPQVEMEESQAKIDDATGTKIYEDAGKTVFANWVYVSPKETAEIKYSYLLPFKINPGQRTKPADTYSLLAQKQSGSLGSKFTSKISYPGNFNIIWKYPDDKVSGPSGSTDGKKEVTIDDMLRTDKFVGVAFTK